MSKPIVRYTPSKDDFIEVGRGAFVYPADHWDNMNVSNHQIAHTSTVLQYTKDTGEFETKNSVYVPIDK